MRLDATTGLSLAEFCHYSDSKTFGTASSPVEDWRIRERIRTVAAGLLLCLHVGVDPPDVLKTNPTARLECWTEPDEEAAGRDTVARNLQQQFEFWQPRAKYRVLQDPTVEEVRKLCQSLRRSAKEERVLLHYNGHGVPRPTAAGELWLFNKQYTQYIPTAVSDVAQWLAGPSLLIADCSAAGNIFEAYRRAAEGTDFLMLVACGTDEVLPMAPEMPADIFTACLTTPMEIAIRWHVYRAGPLMPAISLETAMSLPGRLGDRRTALGELNWILTAITDTIAWSVLPRQLFKRLFRQDVLVASLFRNYLLALRIMKQFRCTARCWPAIPSSAVIAHELWQAWDQALDCALSQIPDPTLDLGTVVSLGEYEASSFFAGQLDAFEQWISQCALMEVPSGNAVFLPIVLQVLLSQSHRIRALNLLGLFMDLGDWAVLDALHVGVFPYILKLFQAPSGDAARYPLLYLWLRILVGDAAAAADLRKEDSYLFLTRILCQELEESFDLWETRSMACICLAVFCRLGREQCDLIMRAEGLVPQLLHYAKGTAPVLAEWALHLLSLLVENCYYYARADEAVRMLPSWIADLVDEPLLVVLDDERCENRAAAVHLLGALLGAPLLEESVEAEIIYRLLSHMGEFYPTARRELAIALSRFIARHVARFTLTAYDLCDGWAAASPTGSRPRRPTEFVAPGTGDMVRHPGIYTLVWKACLMLSLDPSDLVAPLARRLVDEVHLSFLFPATPAGPPHDKTLRIVFVTTNPALPASASASASTTTTPPSSTASQQSPLTNETRLSSAIPMASPILTEAADAFIAHQKRRKALLHRKQSDVVQARIKKLQLLDADDSRRWATLPAPQRRFEHPAGVIDVGAPVSRVLFHPLKERVLTADEQGRIGVWHYDGRRVNVFSCLQDLGRETPAEIRRKYRVTALACVDWDPIKLLVATNDGVVRLYDDFMEEGAQSLRAAWSMGPGPAGSNDDEAVALLLEWNQHQRRLFTVAAGREISVVDAQREAVVQRIAVPPDTRSTAVTSDRRESPILTLGFSDGWLRRYDLRQPDRSIGALKGHDSWIIGVRHSPSAGGIELISGAVQGELLLWDPRQPSTPLRRVLPARHGLLALDVHSTLSVTVCATANQSLRILEDDQLRGQIKHHEGLLGRRIGPVEDVVFHPRRLLVAAGSTDGLVSLFTAKSHS